MKFTPRKLEDNANVSSTNPLAELTWLLGGLVLLVAIVFLALGLATDLAVSKTPMKVENWLGEHVMRHFPAKPNPQLQKRLNALLPGLPDDSPLRNYNFRIYLSEADDINAIALPGGNIIVFKGLLEQVETENELAMILYHELGHYAHRDHLRSLGRGLGLTVASALLFGRDSVVSDLAAKTLLGFQVNYSQSQEAAADRFGLEMLTRHYGHAGGATDFFSRLAGRDASRLAYIFASHPHPQDRIDTLNDLISEHGYTLGITHPFDSEPLVNTALSERNAQ